MSLHLTDDQVRRIRELQELLLAPLRFPSPRDWLQAVHETSTTLFGVNRSLAVLPAGRDDVLIDAPYLGEDTRRGLKEALVGTGPGMNRYGDRVLARAMERLAISGAEVWNRETAERITQIPLERMPRFYPEVIRPGHLEGMLMMGHSLREGRAMLGVFPDGDTDTAFGEMGVEVFRLLQPAFRVGSRLHALAASRWRRLGASLDILEEGVAVYADGGERYRNRSLRRLLEEETQPERLISEIERCSRKMARAYRERGPLEALADVTAEVTTDRNRYRIAASQLSDGYSGAPTTVLVAVTPVVPLLPSEDELRERYGLTAREAEVAVLLAHGHSNREIAERLVISRHTARHHAQRVLEKTGAESRKALALWLLSDRGS